MNNKIKKVTALSLLLTSIVTPLAPCNSYAKSIAQINSTSIEQQIIVTDEEMQKFENELVSMREKDNE